MTDPACRLLTLIGVGGVGKTRLAIEAASGLLGAPDPSGRSLNVSSGSTQGRDESFADGAYFVALQAVNSAEFLVLAVADALNLSLSGPEEPRVQLLNYLRDREMLLLLDNIEQLLGEGGATLLASILETAPSVKMLVTSQVVLNLQEEWLYPVPGMSFPESTETDDVEAYGAVKLFVERARRVDRDFSLTDERDDVIRICQLVEGVPLALELAAAWTKSLRCAVIAAEIQRNIDFLATGLRNIPDRQRSIRAVFDHSWKLLAEAERRVFRRLSVFQDGFRREAAKRVAGASLSTLSALVDKSLLRSGPDDRYQIHELLRQYAAEQLVLSPEDGAGVYDWHCAYYANFLFERWEDMSGGLQLESVAEIETDLENIRAAWQWAIEQVKVEEIQKSAGTLSFFYQFQSRYLEGADTLERARQHLMGESATEQTDMAQVVILVHLGWFYIRLGRLEEAKETLAQCRALYRRLDVPPVPGGATDPLLALGIIASIRGDYAEAARLGEQARQISEAHNHPWNRQLSYYLLARAALLQGEYETAHQYAQQAYAITKEADNRWFMAYCHIELGNVACALGDYAAAKEHYEASYALRQEFDDPEGMAMALNHLGEIAIRQDSYAEARQLYLQSLAIYRKISDRGGLATSLNGLGNTAVALGKYDPARQRFHQALQIATEMQFVPLILSLLIGIGELLLQTGQKERGLELLTLALYHPASEQETRERVQRLLTRYEAEHPPDVLVAPNKWGVDVAYDLAAVTTDLLTELSTSEEPVEVTPPPVSHFVPRADQPLIDPLSERELEVLHFIATGLQNREIAQELTVTLSTVKTHINNIYRKLDVNNRVQAVGRARELDLL